MIFTPFLILRADSDRNDANLFGVCQFSADDSDTQIKMYLSDNSILELFGRFSTVCTVYYSALKYIFIWVSDTTTLKAVMSIWNQILRHCVEI